MTLVTRYSRDFSGNLAVDPNGSWVLAADAKIRDNRIMDKLAAETLRADTAEAELKIVRESHESMRNDLIDIDAKLAAAEQRVSELSGDNQQLRKLLNQTLAALNPTAKLAKSIRAALKPKLEAGSHVDCGSCRNITDGCKDKCQRSEESSKP